MGSLKDEMRGLREDHKPCEKTDDGERPGGSDGSTECERPQINTSQESTTHQPKLHMNASYGEEGDDNGKSKEISAKDLTQTDAILLTQQPAVDGTTAASQNGSTASNQPLSDGEGDGDGGIQGETSQDKDMGHDREKEEGINNIYVPVPATPGPSDPCSPAPSGQHHMRTQVSLEVVQCCSAATSPMTPPEGGNSFIFPSSFGKCGAMVAGTKDAAVGQQVEFCSVATSPMTPKTPSITAFPVLIGKETVQKGKESGQQESSPVTKSQEEAESDTALKSTTSKEPSEGFGSSESPESSSSCPADRLKDSQVSPEDGDQQCKQQRMGSMDQDITILVTHHGNNDNEEEENPIEAEMVKIDENEELRGNDVKREDGEEAGDPSEQENSNPPQNKTEESVVSASDKPKTENSAVQESKDGCQELRDVTKPPVPESPAPFGCHNIRTQVSLEVVQCQSVATSPMTPPEGDHAFYFPSSAGRSEGVGTETKDAELQVGQQVEFRSVATAPMTPRTPTVTVFPEVRKNTSIEEKIVEEEEEKKEQVEEEEEEKEEQVEEEEEEKKEQVEEEEEEKKEQVVEEEEEKKEQVVEDKEEEKASEEEKVEAADEDMKEEVNSKEKCEEPVQEVSWDEKGMTWEVYGAVVEVAVLGSAIQKHLEKQVKKQKQPSMPPPPPLNPSAMPLSSESIQGGSGSGSGSGKGRAGKRGERGGEVSRRRRNPFRQLMENMQQPHCCSRAHTAE